MKAKEYFEKYHEGLYEEYQTGERKHLSNLLTEMLREATDILEKRKVKFDRGLMGVIKEQNDKWNAIVNLLEKKYGVLILKRDGFKKWMKYELSKNGKN